MYDQIGKMFFFFTVCADRARLLGKEPCLTVADYVIVGCSLSETGDCRGKVPKYKRE